ncbi:hypothetical protein HK105_202653 [Polyrhizophydium stewartii]|uniref:Uncharacterized protein n=1 Tax=Polyrhizophydium stewartii TaxID=2732419 RepID=A0ABR4NE10_9FUNG
MGHKLSRLFCDEHTSFGATLLRLSPQDIVEFHDMCNRANLASLAPDESNRFMLARLQFESLILNLRLSEQHTRVLRNLFTSLAAVAARVHAAAAMRNAAAGGEQVAGAAAIAQAPGPFLDPTQAVDLRLLCACMAAFVAVPLSDRLALAFEISTRGGCNMTPDDLHIVVLAVIETVAALWDEVVVGSKTADHHTDEDQKAVLDAWFRNAFSATTGKALYTSVRTDPVATTKIKANEKYIAIPGVNATSVGILPVPQSLSDEPVKMEQHAPYLLAHGKQIQDMTFAPSEPSIIATSTRSDTLIRIWSLPHELPRAQVPPTETDVASVFLAGHEKRVELLRFHPSCPGILASCASDATIRLWSVETFEDRISLTCPAETTAQSLAFDYEGDLVVAGMSDAMLHVYDPRASTDPQLSVFSDHAPAKGCRVAWMAPDTLIASIGFAKTGGDRCVHVWDTRAFDEPVQTLALAGSGVGLLAPFWDPALPLLYLAAKGEGVRVLELDQGSLRLAATAKVEKQAVAMDLLPKSVCDAKKCEIARFIRLGTDSAIEMTSIFVPRVNAEAIFQEDLFPLVCAVNKDANAAQWFDASESIQPWMVDMAGVPAHKASADAEPLAAVAAAADQPAAGATGLAPPKQHAHARNRSPSLRRTGTMRGGRAGGHHTREGSSASGRGSSTARGAGIPSSGSLSQSMDLLGISEEPPLLEGVLGLERRGWFGSVWEPVYVAARQRKLYLAADKNPDSPMRYLRFAAMSGTTPFAVSPADDSGLQIDVQGQAPHRFKAASKDERDRWVAVIQQHIAFEAPPSLSASAEVLGTADADQRGSGSSLALPTTGATGLTRGKSIKLAAQRMGVNPDAMAATHGSGQTAAPGAPGPQPNRRAPAQTALLMGSLLQYTSPTPRAPPAWVPRLGVLDLDGTLHMFQDDVKAFAQGSAPLESLNLATATSVRLAADEPLASAVASPSHTTVISARPTTFHINTPNRANHFCARNAKDAADWILQIIRVVKERGFMPAAETIDADVVEGPVELVPTVPVATSPGAAAAMAALPFKAPPRGAYWLSIIDGALFYFSGKLATTPVCVVPSAHVSGFADLAAAQPDLGEPETQGFVVKLTDGMGEWVHKVETGIEHTAWMQALARMRREHYNVLGRIGIASYDALLREMAAAASKDAQDPGAHANELVTHIDANKLAKGEQQTLIALHGRVRLTVTTVAPTWTSLRNNSAFVLDVGSSVFHWGGPNASRVCRAQALDVASRIRKARSNRPALVLVEPDDAEVCRAFFGNLGAGDPSHHVRREQPDCESDAEIAAMAMQRLFVAHTSPSAAATAGSVRVQSLVRLVYEGAAPSKTLLPTPDGVCIVQGRSEVLVWHGKQAHSDVKALAAFVAQRLAAQMAVQSDLFITMHTETEGLESVLFKEKFCDYEGSIPISMRIDDVEGHIARHVVQKPIDVAALHTPAPPIAYEMFDTDASGTWTHFRIKQFSREPVSRDLAGQLFRGESYVLVYVYRPPMSGVDKCVSYFWQGSASTITEKGTSALMTVELSQQSGLEVTQVRVVEGKEPLHLIMILGGVAIRLGTSPPRTPTTSGILVFDVRQCYAGKSKPVEVDPRETCFNVNHALVILTATHSVVWIGRHSTEPEQASARETAQRFGAPGCPLVQVRDGADAIPSHIAEQLGGLGVALPQAQQQHWPTRTVPKLFSCSGASGSVEVAHVPAFTQEDLDGTMVMILDAVSHVFVWFGGSARPSEKLVALETAVEYINTSTTHDKKRTIQAVTFQGVEPPEFTRHFHGWTRAKIPKEKASMSPRSRPLADVLKEFKKETYPIDVLLSDRVPEHLDRTKLEMYLSEDDFESIFRMRRDEYMAMQQWKRDKIRKEVGFF